MSQATKWVRAHGFGPVLDAIEGAAPNTVQAAHDEANSAASVLLSEAGNAVSAVFQSTVAEHLGSGATFAESALNSVLAEIKALVLSKIG